MRFHNKLGAAALAFGALAVCGSAAGQEAQRLPDAPGRKLVLKLCTGCHEIDEVVAARRTRTAWEESVDDMIGRGAEGSDEDMAAVVEYLAAYFGKVNVNTAPADELEKMLGLSAKEAQAIVAFRERNGKIKSFEDLKKVTGVSADKLQAKRGLIAF